MDIPIDQQNIIAILGVAGLPDEQKMAIVEEVTGLVQKRLLAKIFELQDALRRKELAEILEKGSAKELSEFLEHHVPDLQKLADAETTLVKQDLAAWVEQLDQL